MADGTITFSTALDNEQLERDLKRTEREVESLRKKVEAKGSDESFLKSKMEEAQKATDEAREKVERLKESLGAEDGSKELAQHLREATKEAEGLAGSLDEKRAQRTALEEELDNAIAKEQEAVAKLEELEAKAAELREQGDTRGAGDVRMEMSPIKVDLNEQDARIEELRAEWEEAGREVEEYEAKVAEANASAANLQGELGMMQEAESALKQQEAEAGRLEKRWKATTEQVVRYKSQLESAEQRQKELGEEYGRTYSAAGAAVSRGVDGASSALDKFSRRIGTMLKRVFVFGVILKAVRAVTDALGGALQKNQRFSASFAGLKAAVQGWATGVANVIAPALSAMINAVTAALMRLAMLVDSVFHTNITRSIQEAQAAAEQEWAAAQGAAEAADATEDQADAARDLAKAQKEANKTLLAFDQLNQMQADDDGDDGGGSGSGGGGGAGGAPGEVAGNVPNWDALDVGKIDAKLAEIMLILGAALMAVGAILAFSGINIPLGLTLMVIGALMIYTAYQEQWDKLSSEVREAITACLVITGIVLVVLGAVLAFSGVNIPLGIGMMVAGALMLWTAVAINWDTMTPEIQNVVTVLMGILSVALLVIGGILLFTGANVPLGVALMAVGAASLGAVAAINWERMPEEVQAVVSAVLAVLGTALLAVGAILALTGVSLPLGLGLMAAGAVVLGTDAALNWEALSSDLERTVGIIEAVVGSALLVVGAVLAFSGVNIPLGLGLLLVGAVSLGTAYAQNWDSLPDSVKRTIATIKLAVGGALLVVGAILALSGVNLPLGLGLLAVGALSLGTALTDDWDLLPDEVQSVVLMIEAAVGGALLALGAILALTGVNLPLGLGLMVAGALALIHLATLDWNQIPDGVRDTVTEILGIAGSALLVLGIILCVTGVGIPLGIACILAGVASYVTAAALNWDFILNTIRDVWDNICSWWDSNVAPIFTYEWWANLATNAVNGLIGVLNSALSSTTWFINEIAGGIDDLLNFFGVGGTGFYLDAPQIPYLAQGAVIPPNRKFMAVLGDQRYGNNIETPEALMRQVVREEAAQAMAELAGQLVLSMQGAAPEGDVVIMVDSREIGRASMRGIRSLQASGQVGDLLFT